MLGQEHQSALKIYLETSFFSYLTGRETPVELIALRQNSTRLWWRDESVKHNLFISQHVTTEAADGSPDMAAKRLEACRDLKMLDGSTDEVDRLAKALLAAHAVPNTEVTDAYHIATAAVHKMDVLLTWNCKHMANRFALPKTISVVQKAGYDCPAIVTPDDFMKEELDA